MFKIIWRWKLTIVSLFTLLAIYNVPRVISSELDFTALMSILIVAMIATLCEWVVNGFNAMEKKAE